MLGAQLGDAFALVAKMSGVTCPHLIRCAVASVCCTPGQVDGPGFSKISPSLRSPSYFTNSSASVLLMGC